MYNFITTARPSYFSRHNDIVFFLGENFTLKIKSLLEKDSDLEKPIVSFVINRKVGNAVVRNKLKRRLRVIFNQLSQSILHKNFCYILVAKPNIKTLSFSELSQTLQDNTEQLLNHKRFVNHLKQKVDV